MEIKLEDLKRLGCKKYRSLSDPSQQTMSNTCPNSRIAVEESVKYVQTSQLRHQNDVNDVVLKSLLLILNIFYNLF